MKITVSRAELVNKGACSDGLAWFDNLAQQLMQGPDTTIEWDALSMVWALCSGGRGYVRWAIEEGVLPQWSLQGANLFGSNLIGSNLISANLNYANLSGANLRRANLISANLQGAYYPDGAIPEGWRRTETGHLTKA